MSKRFMVPLAALAVLILLPFARFCLRASARTPRAAQAQSASGGGQGGRTDITGWGAHSEDLPPDVDGWGHPIAKPSTAQPAPAPKHDISGIWDPGDGGIQALGAAAIPDDGKPGHHLSYTPAGLDALKQTKPSNGTRSVLPVESNDPVIAGDPQGFPREDLYELRTTQIVQTPVQTIVLYEFGKVWRVIWHDGRTFPKEPEPRFYGYSIGKWVDDYTYVVNTIGLDDRSWLDHTGRPHSADLKVEERFHRVDHDHLELTVTVDDPQFYTKPWVAMDKLRFNLEPATFDVREMIWSPSEFAEYNKLIGGQTSSK